MPNSFIHLAEWHCARCSFLNYQSKHSIFQKKEWNLVYLLPLVQSEPILIPDLQLFVRFHNFVFKMKLTQVLLGFGWLALLSINIFLALPLLQAYWASYLCVTGNNVKFGIMDYNRWLMRTTHAMGDKQVAMRSFLWASHINFTLNIELLLYEYMTKSSI